MNSGFNLSGGFTGGIRDKSTTPFIPYKQGNKLINSPFYYDETQKKIVSTKTLEIPPGTLQIGEGSELNAAISFPIFKSRVTGQQFFCTLYERTVDGTNDRFYVNLDPESVIVSQPDYSFLAPNTGTFQNSVDAPSFTYKIRYKVTPNTTLTNFRSRVIDFDTGNPLYYYPSKQEYLDGVGVDIADDGLGNIEIDISDAPFALFPELILETDYAFDTGELLGNNLGVPYQAAVQQTGEIIYLRDVCFAAVNTTTITIPNTDTVLTANHVEHSENIQFNTSTGVVTFTDSGCYVIQVTFNVKISSASAKIIEIWTEKYNESTLLWEPVSNSGFKREIAGSAEGGVTYIRTNEIEKGSKYRILSRSNDATAVTFLAGTLTNGIVVPSIVYAIKN